METSVVGQVLFVIITISTAFKVVKMTRVTYEKMREKLCGADFSLIASVYGRWVVIINLGLVTIWILWLWFPVRLLIQWIFPW